MTRRMRPAPKGITLAKTSRGTWIALQEIWRGDVLVELIAMHWEDGTIIETHERREILMHIERALLETKYREAQQRIAELEKGGNARGTPPARYANVG